MKYMRKNFKYNFFFEYYPRPEMVAKHAIPESTCLLASAKTRSSGIINNLVPRTHEKI